MRLLRVIRFQWPKVQLVFTWLFTSRETTNHTYDLTERNLSDLADLIAVITGCPRAEVIGYIREPLTDSALLSHINNVISRSPSLSRSRADHAARFGRRLGWYAFARILKPRMTVETGVDKGLGSVLLCSALLRNMREGFPGRYFGTDINPRAGYLLCGEYASAGSIHYGDSIESLRQLSGGVDLFINDSDHSSDYEYAEYHVIEEKLSPSAVILSDNAHATDSLRRFAQESERQFLFFSEAPKDHWYPGGGIGIAVPHLPITKNELKAPSTSS